MGSRSRRRAHGRQAANVGCVVRRSTANQPGATASDDRSRTRSATIENRNQGQKMTTTTIQRPETIRLADALKRRTPFLDGSSTIDHAEKELRRQHAEIARLTAENETLKLQLLKATTPRAWAEYCLAHRTVDATDQVGEKVRGACHGVAP